jgi:uncharacterized protein YjbI with pentapeptide repeats
LKCLASIAAVQADFDVYFKQSASCFATNPNQNDPNQNDANLCNPNLNDPNLNDPNLNDPNLCNPNLFNPNLNDPNLNDPNLNDPKPKRTSPLDPQTKLWRYKCFFTERYLFPR